MEEIQCPLIYNQNCSDHPTSDHEWICLTCLESSFVVTGFRARLVAIFAWILGVERVTGGH